MTSHPDNEFYTVADLDPILDELAGITGLATLDWEDLDEIPELPLPEGLVDRVVDELMRSDGPRSARWSRRVLHVAALMPAILSISYVLVVPWIPTDSSNLSYEEAHIVAFDPSYSAESRNVAVGKITRAIWHGVLALRHEMHANPALRREGAATLQAIQNLLDDPGLADGGQLNQDGTFQKIVDRLRTATTATDLRRTMRRYVGGAMSGFAVLHLATRVPGLVGEQAKKRLDQIQRSLKTPIDKLKKPPPLRK